MSLSFLLCKTGLTAVHHGMLRGSEETWTVWPRAGAQEGELTAGATYDYMSARQALLVNSLLPSLPACASCSYPCFKTEGMERPCVEKAAPKRPGAH